MTEPKNTAGSQKASLSSALGMAVAEARRNGLPVRDAFLVVSMLAAELGAQGIPAADIMAMSTLLSRLAGHRN
jgi:hypothetical protein